MPAPPPAAVHGPAGTRRAIPVRPLGSHGGAGLMVTALGFGGAPLGDL
jgi:hypothetical protein